MLWVNNCSPTITNCTFEYAHEQALYYYADQNYDTTPQITNNTFTNCPIGIYMQGKYDGAFDHYLTEATISNNIISGGNSWGIQVSNISAGSVFASNMINNQVSGISISGCSPMLNSNSITGCTGITIEQSGTCSPTYSGNTITDNTNQMIAINGSITKDMIWPDVQGLRSYS